MLILMRRIGEVIHLGDQITVTVTAVRGNQVSLGIIGPREIKVYRAEIWQKIQEENARREGFSA
jgi:carbon storage regulator